MGFSSYDDCGVELAVDLVNSYGVVSGKEDLVDENALGRFLDDRRVTRLGSVSKRDLRGVRRLRSRLRDVFTAGDERVAVDIINELLVRSGALPQLVDHVGEPWHLHYHSSKAPLASHLEAEAAMALALMVRDFGYDRFQLCEHGACRDVFIDVSRNRSRRYCSPKVCGNRASVAAYRDRQRSAATR
ncbi:MAG: CGNR zinc finger domain-containing protein [Actinomycetota bacterium]|nr:CGNR zinc finger domain-containing protein [Actinomycetota bacterium]